MSLEALSIFLYHCPYPTLVGPARGSRGGGGRGKGEKKGGAADPVILFYSLITILTPARPGSFNRKRKERGGQVVSIPLLTKNPPLSLVGERHSVYT